MAGLEKRHSVACKFAELPRVWHVILGKVIRQGDRNAHFKKERLGLNNELRQLTDTRNDIHTLGHKTTKIAYRAMSAGRQGPPK